MRVLFFLGGEGNISLAGLDKTLRTVALIINFPRYIQGDLNLGCDALAEGNSYSDCHPLPSISGIFVVGTPTVSSADGPSLCPMAIEEPPHSPVLRGTRSSSDDLGILDANGSTGGGVDGGGGGGQWCGLVRCGGGDVEKCSRKKTCTSRRSISGLCQGGGNRMIFFGALATILFVATVVVAVIVYYCTGKHR